MLRFSFIFFFILFQYLAEAQKEQIKLTDCMHLIQEARAFLQEDELRKAKKKLKEIDLKEKETSATCQAAFFLLEGEIHLSDGDYGHAKLLLQDALLFYTKLNDSKGVINASYQLAMTYIEDDEQEKAAEQLDEIIAKKETLAQSEYFNEVLDTRAMLYSVKGEHSAAMRLLKEAAEYAVSAKDFEIQGQLFNQISTNYQTLGKVDSAIFYYKKLLEVKKELGDQEGLLSDYSALGSLHKELGNYEAAQVAFIEAIRYGETLKDTLSLLAIYIDVANIYFEQRMLEPALEYTQKARRLAKEKNALLVEGQSLQIRASIFEEFDQLDQALINYQQAFAIFQQLGLKQEMADVQLKIAFLFDSNDNLEKAEVYLRDALQIRIETGDKMGELTTQLALCDVSLKLSKNQLEIGDWLDNCQAIALQTGNANGQQEVLRLKAQFYENKGKHKEALASYRSFNTLRDSIVNQENAELVRELEKRYDTEKKDKEIAQQQSEINQQKIALRARNTQIVQLLAGLLVLLILVFLTIITYQRNRQFNKQKLSVIEKERETQMLRAMVTGEEQERRRIARDLHDGLGAIMATAKMRVSALSNHVPDIKELESFQKAEELIDDACKNIREISHNMMPGSLSKYGLEVAISDMCDAIEQTNEVEISFIPYGLDHIMDEVVEINIYRIVQELLKNIIKHAEASEAIVQLTIEEGLLNIVVEDDGKGFDMEQTKIKEGIGIGSIRSRVLYLDGKMEIDSTPNQGTTFTIDVPMATNQKQKIWSKS